MIKNVKEIINGSLSTYTGSEMTRSMVEEQIKDKYGPTELKNLDCYHNLRTFHSWLSLGFKVKKGEKAIKSITYVEQKEAGKIIKKYRRPVFLFYYRQIEPISQSKTV